MVKTSTHGYVKTKINNGLYFEEIIVIPTGKKDGDRAEFLPLTAGHPERLWLLREDIY